MDAKELMIGNYVFVDNEKWHPNLIKEIMIVIGVDNHNKKLPGIVRMNAVNSDLNFQIPLASQYDKYVKPIPLTEQWLVDFGFEIKDSVNKGYLKKINLDWQKEYLYCNPSGTNALWNDEKEQDFIIMNKIKYVHQLQNLYKALTGNQLTK